MLTWTSFFEVFYVKTKGIKDHERSSLRGSFRMILVHAGSCMVNQNYESLYQLIQDPTETCQIIQNNPGA